MKVSLNRILCATDLSVFSKRVLHYGIGLAERFSARLFVFHSIYAPTSPPDGTGVVELSHRHPDHEKQILDNIAEIMAGRDVDWKPVITYGEPAEEAARMARELNVDLVVTASQGMRGLRRFLLGTVVERLARYLSCPILVVHAPGKTKEESLEDPPVFKRILWGTNYPPDRRVMKYALTLAREYQSRVQVLHCLEAPGEMDMADEVEASYSEAQQSQVAGLEGRLNELMTDMTPDCGDLETVLAVGNPGDQLYSYASEQKADLIIIGIRPQKVWERLLNYSTTEAIIRNAPCPVLAIPTRSPLVFERTATVG